MTDRVALEVTGNAIDARNPEQAERIMRNHLERVADALERTTAET